MNNITIAGRLARDPESKVVGDGIELITFSVAVDRYQGKDKDKAVDYFECSVFGARGQVIKQYMHKGDQIICGGEMVSNTVEKDGSKRTYWNVKVNDFDFGAKKGGGTTAPASNNTLDAVEDELPF